VNNPKLHNFRHYTATGFPCMITEVFKCENKNNSCYDACYVTSYRPLCAPAMDLHCTLSHALLSSAVSRFLLSTSAVYLRPMTIPARPKKYWQYNREDYRCTRKICIVPLQRLFAAMPPVCVERHWSSRNLCAPTPRVRLSVHTGFAATSAARSTRHHSR